MGVRGAVTKLGSGLTPKRVREWVQQERELDGAKAAAPRMKKLPKRSLHKGRAAYAMSCNLA